MNVISQTGRWNEISATLNDNFNLIAAELTRLGGAAYKAKGFFDSVDKLTSAYPTPPDGSYAYVGTAQPYLLYSFHEGVWKVTAQNVSLEEALDSVFDWSTIPSADEITRGLMTSSHVVRLGNLETSITEEVDARTSSDNSINANLSRTTERLNRLVMTIGDHNLIAIDSENIIDLNDMVGASGIYRVLGNKQHIENCPPVTGTSVDATIINKVIRPSLGGVFVSQFVVLISDVASDGNIWYRKTDKDTLSFGKWVSVDAFNTRINKNEQTLIVLNQDFESCQTQVDELYSFLTKLKTAFGTEDLDVIVNKVAEVANAEGDVFITM